MYDKIRLPTSAAPGTARAPISFPTEISLIGVEDILEQMPEYIAPLPDDNSHSDDSDEASTEQMPEPDQE